MSFTEKRLCNPTQLTTSGQTLYTVPASKTAIVKQIVVTNVTGSAATFSLFIGSAATPNALFSATSVAANDAIVINLSQVLNSTEILTALASANSTLNITISGVENDGPLNPLSTYIADGAITTAKLADSSVTSAKIADGAVVTADIANNAITQAKLSTDVPLSGMRNVIINGDFRIWQRGLSKAMATGQGTGYLADRWYAARNGYTAGGTVSRQLASLDGFQYCSRIQRDSGNTSVAVTYYFQTLETVNSIPLANKPVVYSFYARAGSTFTGNVVAKVYGGTSTDQMNYPDSGIAGGTTIVSSSITLTTSWQRFIFYGTVGATVTQLFVGFEWTPVGTAGTNGISDYFEVTGIQLETGSQITPFEQRPYGVEFALCQRYYQVLVNASNQPICNIAYTAANTFEGVAHLITEMRTAPSLAPQTTNGTNYYVALTFGGGYDYVNYVYLDSIKSTRAVFLYNNSEAAGTAGQAGFWWGYSGAGNVQVVALQAEL